MKSALLKFAFLFIAASCICGMCSKNDAGSDDNNTNNNVEPDLKPDATWVYFDDCPGLVQYYNSLPNATGFNKRPQFQKWVATKTSTAFSGLNTTTGKRYMTWSFENTGNTRFLSNTLNPGGKENLSVFINEIAATPGVGSYTIDIDYKQGFCWYDVYASSGAKHDSTRTQGIDNSTLNITKMDFFQSIGTTVDRYKMSGTATFNIMYWKNGTSSTTDIHTLQCHFNNVLIDFLK